MTRCRFCSDPTLASHLDPDGFCIGCQDYIDNISSEEAEWPSQDDDFDDREGRCHTCGGDGYGIVGTDWDSDDPINGPYPGEIQRCPNCGGSGDAADCWFW